MASEEENKQDDVVATELPAPAGWVKKFNQTIWVNILWSSYCRKGIEGGLGYFRSRLDMLSFCSISQWRFLCACYYSCILHAFTPKKGGTPQRNDIVFISPTGEEIKNKRLLDQYLKSHPGGPAASEFDWGTGDTPRRSARLNEKSKAAEAPPASQSPKKRRKKSSPKEAEDKSNADAEGEATDEKDADPEETKESADVDTKEAGDGEAIPEKVENEVVSEEPSAVGETQTENLNANVEKSNDAKIEESKEASSEKEIQDGKVDCAEPVVEDKGDLTEKQEAEKSR